MLDAGERRALQDERRLEPLEEPVHELGGAGDEAEAPLGGAVAPVVAREVGLGEGGDGAVAVVVVLDRAAGRPDDLGRGPVPRPLVRLDDGLGATGRDQGHAEAAGAGRHDRLHRVGDTVPEPHELRPLEHVHPEEHGGLLAGALHYADGLEPAARYAITQKYTISFRAEHQETTTNVWGADRPALVLAVLHPVQDDAPVPAPAVGAGGAVHRVHDEHLPGPLDQGEVVVLDEIRSLALLLRDEVRPGEAAPELVQKERLALLVGLRADGVVAAAGLSLLHGDLDPARHGVLDQASGDGDGDRELLQLPRKGHVPAPCVGVLQCTTPLLLQNILRQQECCAKTTLKRT